MDMEKAKFVVYNYIRIRDDIKNKLKLINIKINYEYNSKEYSDIDQNKIDLLFKQKKQVDFCVQELDKIPLGYSAINSMNRDEKHFLNTAYVRVKELVLYYNNI